MVAEDERTDIRTSALALLGYAGVAAALAGLSIAVGRNASATAQVLADVVAVVALIAAGAAFGDARRDAFVRMRGVLWSGAVAVWAGAVAAFFTDGPDAARLDGKWLVVATAVGAAVLGAPLWILARRSLQLIALYASVLAAAAALVYTQRHISFLSVSATLPHVRWSGVVIVILGSLMLTAGVARAVEPRRTAIVLGSLAAIVGAGLAGVSITTGGPSTDLAPWFALAASVLVLLVGEFVPDRAVAGIGIVGVLLSIATLVTQHVFDRSTAIAVSILGFVALAAAVVLARAFSDPTVPAPPREPQP